MGKGKDVPDHPGIEQLRLICNLVPSNGYFRELRGDVAHLPYMMQWGGIVLEDDEMLLISQEDMTCAFYLFRLPRAWSKYFAVGLKVKLSEVGGQFKSTRKKPEDCRPARTPRLGLFSASGAAHGVEIRSRHNAGDPSETIELDVSRVQPSTHLPRDSEDHSATNFRGATSP